MSKKLVDKKIESYIEKNEQWSSSLFELRALLLKSGLTEEFKWRVPCFTIEGKNVALISAFKSYCAIGFFKGSLLKDKEKMLVAQTENVQSSRLLVFHSAEEIQLKKELINAYVTEAIEIERSGLKIEYKRTEEFIVPEELLAIFKSNPPFQEAFKKLTPGRQRGYLLHFNGAKQSSTRLDRITKCQPRILNGKGLNDCICGKSRRMPNCDGSHKLN